ncbi:MAG: SDR family oxidoreductase [Candidatus Omnitrophota bacterium]
MEKKNIKPSIFLTGATGLVGSYLLKLFLEKNHKVYALARGKNEKTAKERIIEVLKFWDKNILKNKIKNLRVIEGDVAENNLGLDKISRKTLTQEIKEIFHSAAITDLHRPIKEINKVNIEGTRNILIFAEKLNKERLVKVNHISTAYIYGDYKGVFKEESLDVKQKFETNYENTKFEAEKLVKVYRKKGLWIDIFRPSMVIGDTKTGKTFQFRHIYQFINLCALEIFDTLPLENGRVSLVPIDVFCEAAYAITRNSQSKNRNYHPFPAKLVSVEKIIDIGHQIMGFKKPKLVPSDEFNIQTLTPSQRLILQGTILAINFQTKLNSSFTKQVLKRYNFNMPEISDKLLAKNIEYFRQNIRIGGIYHDRKI